MTPAADRVPLVGERAFIGRDNELAAFDNAVERVHEGHGRVVMLAGPPGKTRTAQQMAEHAASADALLLWGRCLEEPGAPPYWPWLQIVRHYVGLHDDATVQATIGAAAGHLAAALDPGLAPRLPPHTPITPPPDAAQARFQLFDAITGF